MKDCTYHTSRFESTHESPLPFLKIVLELSSSTLLLLLWIEAEEEDSYGREYDKEVEKV